MYSPICASFSQEVSLLTTIFTQIEAVLNSRPLTSLSQDPNDFGVLTPGHFLIGRELTALPEPNITHLKTTRLSRWQRLTQLKQHFWQRWSLEYLSEMQQRRKWQKGVTNIIVGQLALIRDDNLPPLKWKLGRISHTHPGADGVVRSVTLKTLTGSYTRATPRICILPSSRDDEKKKDTSVSNLS